MRAVLSQSTDGLPTLGAFVEYNGRPLCCPPPAVAVDVQLLADEDYDGLCASVRTLRQGPAVPEWSAPAEVWRMLLLPLEHLHGGQRFSADIPGRCEVLLRHLLFLVRQQQEVPLLWNLSSPAELDKPNGKTGCSGKRFVHKFDPIGHFFTCYGFAKKIGQGTMLAAFYAIGAENKLFCNNGAATGDCQKLERAGSASSTMLRMPSDPFTFS